MGLRNTLGAIAIGGTVLAVDGGIAPERDISKTAIIEDSPHTELSARFIGEVQRYYRGRLLARRFQAEFPSPEAEEVAAGDSEKSVGKTRWEVRGAFVPDVFPFSDDEDIGDFEICYSLLEDVMDQLSSAECNPDVDRFCVHCCYAQYISVEVAGEATEVARITPNPSNGTVSIEFFPLAGDMDIEQLVLEDVEPHLVPALLAQALLLNGTEAYEDEMNE